MTRFLKNATPEVYFVFSAVIGVLIAGFASRIPGLDLGFFRMLAILLSLDVITYIAMKLGWMKTPRQRNGIDG